MIHALHKKGVTTCLSNFRDVSIANHLPKLLTRHIRKTLIDPFNRKILSTQWGSGAHGGAMGLWVFSREHVLLAGVGRAKFFGIYGPPPWARGPQGGPVGPSESLWAPPALRDLREAHFTLVW